MLGVVPRLRPCSNWHRRWAPWRPPSEFKAHQDSGEHHTAMSHQHLASTMAWTVATQLALRSHCARARWLTFCDTAATSCN